jgi:hypothetical protein
MQGFVPPKLPSTIRVPDASALTTAATEEMRRLHLSALVKQTPASPRGVLTPQVSAEGLGFVFQGVSRC